MTCVRRRLLIGWKYELAGELRVGQDTGFKGLRVRNTHFEARRLQVRVVDDRDRRNLVDIQLLSRLDRKVIQKIGALWQRQRRVGFAAGKRQCERGSQNRAKTFRAKMSPDDFHRDAIAIFTAGAMSLAWLS